jgi:hypothetical protein
MGSEYESRIKGKTSEELLARIEDGQVGSPVAELIRSATYVRALQETADASDRVAQRLNALTLVVALGTAAAAFGALWTVFA